MAVVHRQAGATRRFASTALTAISALLVGACATERSVAPPQLPGQGPVAQFRPQAFIADVNTRTGKVTIIDPARGTQVGPTLSIDGRETPNLSLLGGEAVRLVPSNYQASGVGAITPNKIRVSFDVNIENKLPGVKFITPTWPVAPSAGVILFPLDYVVTTTPGGVTGSDGNEVIVEQPSFGGIVPSIDWSGNGAAGSGAPFNFFNDTDCSLATSNDCFRWEAFDAEILPLSGSTARKVGFDIDASVGQFRVRMIVAADLAAAGVVAPGTISGVVTSTLGGGINNVTVTASSGQTTTTNSLGAYTLAAVNPGSRSVTLSNLPTNCTAPASAGTSVTSGGTSTVNFTVTCTGLPGTVSGTLINSVGGTPIAGATITAASGGSAITSATGTYSIANVMSGSGSLSVTLPLVGFTGCTTPPTSPYVLASAGTTTVNITATCPTPVPNGYRFTTEWSNVSATQVAVIVRINMLASVGGIDDPDLPNLNINGEISDAIFAHQLLLNFDATKLTYVSRSAVAGGVNAFPNPITAPPVGGVLNITQFDTDGLTGNVGIVRILFNRVAGANGTVSLTLPANYLTNAGVIFTGNTTTGLQKSLKPNLTIIPSTFTLP